MRYVFFGLVTVHGLIHLLGFAKAFGLGNVSQLTQAISRPFGVAWLFTGVLTVTVSVLLLSRADWVWAPALAAAIASQMLIISAWQDAKAGTVVNVVLIVFAVLTLANWSFYRQTDREMAALLAGQASAAAPTIVDEAELAALPVPVQRWLKSTGIVGSERPITVHFRQRGEMKLKPEQQTWAHADAEQWVTLDEPGFLWRVVVTDMVPFVRVTGRDVWLGGRADLSIKIASLVPVAAVAQNAKADEASLQRYLLELPIYPFAALNPSLTWEEVNAQTARATMTAGGVSGSVLYHFDETGALRKVSASRFKEHDEGAPRIECVADIREYDVIDGIRIPTAIDISWLLDEGPFTWYRLTISDLTFGR